MLDKSYKNSDWKTVLLVEDDDGDAFLAGQAFKRFDREIDLVRVTGGQDAIQYMRGGGVYENRIEPNCILLDLEMANGDGVWTLQRLAERKGREIPVIILSGEAHRIEATRDYGFVVCAVEKPQTQDAYEELLRVVGRLVRAACAVAA